MKGKSAVRKQDTLGRLLQQYGFRKAASEEDAEAYVHVDGRMAAVGADGAAWMMQAPDVDPVSGTDRADLIALLEKAPVVREVNGSDNVLGAIKLLKGKYNLAALSGESHYKLRTQLIKKLRGVDKLLVKDSGLDTLRREFYAAMKITKSGKEGIAQFIQACEKRLAADAKRTAQLRKAEQARIQRLLAITGSRTVVHDDKPVIEVKRKTKRQRAEELADLKVELTESIQEAEEMPVLATPRPGAAVTLVPGDVRLLEDIDNGLVLLRLEKPNSQGAICVYNNGVRVAAGVVSPHSLSMMRPVDADIMQAARQFLNPVVKTVQVTSTAERHLTAVLNCKELIAMSESKVKKFAAPAKSKKAVKAEAKAAKAEKKAAKADGQAGPRGHRYVLVNEKAIGDHRSPQLTFIVDHLKKAGKDGMLKADLVAAAVKAGDKFPTNQPHDRAIGFYLSKYKGAGALKFAA